MSKLSKSDVRISASKAVSGVLGAAHLVFDTAAYATMKAEADIVHGLTGQNKHVTAKVRTEKSIHRRRTAVDYTDKQISKLKGLFKENPESINMELKH